MEFHGTKTPIDNVDIDNLEAQVGNKLPFSFRQHYLKYNGGRANFEWYEDHLLGEFYVIKHGDFTLEKAEAHAVKMGLFPKGVVPFSSLGSLEYGIDTREPNYGAIYVSCWEGEPHMEFVAPSFEVLLANLKETSDDEDDDEE